MSSRKSKTDKERDKVVQDRLQLLLTRMLKDDDNKYCVDCDSKGPRWASWNLGLFLCIRCAGIHRNLGVHISKVKSVNLDSWTPTQVSSMQLMGNSRARAVYEANLPDGFLRPQNDQALEQFIRAKYEKKKYIAKEYVPQTPAEFPDGWFELIEAEKQKKDLRKIILPSHNNSSNSNGNGNQDKGDSNETKADTTARPKPSIVVSEKTSGVSPPPNKESGEIRKVQSSSAEMDLLGLNLGSNDTQNQDILGALGNDFGPICSASVNKSTPSLSDPSPAFSTETSTADGANVGEDKGKMSKDSIMALFAKSPQTMSSGQMFMNGINTRGPQPQPAQVQGNFGIPSQNAFMGAHPQSNPFLNANPSVPMSGVANLSPLVGQNLFSQGHQIPQSQQQQLQSQLAGLSLDKNSFSPMNMTDTSPRGNQQTAQSNLLGLWQ